jgi:hypothetical protein
MTADERERLELHIQRLRDIEEAKAASRKVEREDYVRTIKRQAEEKRERELRQQYEMTEYERQRVLGGPYSALLESPLLM